MRLGGWFDAARAEDLEPLCSAFDRHGLSAIRAPARLAQMSDEECFAFGAEAGRLGLVIGEAGMWDNLMSSDPERRAHRIELVRTMLRKAELMGCRCVVSLVGSGHPADSHIAPDPVMRTPAGQAAFREVVLRILDGLDLQRTSYAIEPWRTSFFWQPEDILAFLDDLGDPRVRFHLDLVNVVDMESFFETARLVERTFGMLSDRIVAAHLKDLAWDWEHMPVKWDEVMVGDGIVDYEAYLSALARLDADLPCYCEHLTSEAEYAESFARLHRLAGRAGLHFTPRSNRERRPAG